MVEDEVITGQARLFISRGEKMQKDAEEAIVQRTKCNYSLKDVAKLKADMKSLART